MMNMFIKNNGNGGLVSRQSSCRTCFFLMMLFVFILLSAKFVAANFVCGEVLDSEKMSASWYDVRIFYDENNDYANCEVSPGGNKYCCDTEAIPGKTWKIGDEVSAEIFDFESGYFAGPVSVITTGEGYDVFPRMQLKKAIKVFEPSKKLIFSNKSELLLNASFAEPYNFVEIEKDEDKTLLCQNCSTLIQRLKAEFGMNYWKLIASHGKRFFSENIVFALLKSFGFERKIECEKCKKNKVKSGQEVSMTLILNLSHEVRDFELREYVPVEWEILETDGRVEEYSSSHNIITVSYTHLTLPTN